MSADTVDICFACGHDAAEHPRADACRYENSCDCPALDIVEVDQ